MDDILAKYCEEQSLPIQIAKEHEKELKRYLALLAINPTVIYGMIGPVDELWHTFVLFTRKYNDFCMSITGRFLHHDPSIPGKKLMDKKHYQRTLKDYEIIFQENPPQECWPRLLKGKWAPACANGGGTACGGDGDILKEAVADVNVDVGPIHKAETKKKGEI